ncbi:MAG: TetR/AcrR family transcriptional regulator [Lutisporaceae bacterium]
MKNLLSRKEREKIEIEKTILQHAEDLFSLNGYENTSMDALATSCEYTKRTIYRYFTCKEDLYFAVMLKGHTRLFEAIQSENQKGSTGYEKIKLSYKAFSDFYMESSSLFDLMTQIKAIKSKKNPNDLPYFRRYADCIRALYKEILSLFEMAHNDKSIRTDVAASQLGFSSIFLLNGFFHMLSLSGDSFVDFFALDKEQFIGITIKMLFQLLDGEKL